MSNKQSDKTREYGETLTPEWMVKGTLEATEPSVSSSSIPILDMCAGTGNFIVEIVQRRCMNTDNPIDAISHTLAYEGHRKLTIDGCDSLIRDETAITIVSKAHDYIVKHDNQSFDRMMLGTTPFGLPSDIKTFDNVTEKDSNHTIDVLCIKNRHVFVTRESVKKNIPSIDKWNVAVQLCHNQHDPNPISEPIILPPNSICTHSWVCTTPVNSKEEAESIASYMRTRAFRFLVSTKKIPPIGTRKVCSLVPTVPFDREWDDNQIEKELGLTPSEIAYIHETTPEM